MPEITLPAGMEYLERLIQFVADQAEAAGFLSHRINEIELAAEEILVNIINYAYPGVDGVVSIMCLEERGRLILEFSDTGMPFNILNVPAPDVNAELLDRKVGGLGVFFVKKMANESVYRRERNRNILTLIFDKHRRGAEVRGYS